MDFSVYKRCSYLLLFTSVFLLSGCQQEETGKKPPKLPKVKVMEIVPVDAPAVFEFVGQAQSSRQVEIRARVDGFLEKVAYEEGSLVEDGQVLFELDKKPFEANLQQAKGELALQNARLVTASANLKRIRPLAEQDAVSQKDLDDAVGSEKASQASVLAAEGSVREAELNLGYATIYSPVKGLASKTNKQEGSYVPTGTDSLLTYVAQLDPIWVNFSISENQVLSFRKQINEGKLKEPPKQDYDVEVVFGDGTVHPHRGRISFSEPNLDTTTGTFLLRAELANPEGKMRPGQFVRVLLHGAVRPNAIMVPQEAVTQGSKGHFVWVLDTNNKTQLRAIQAGSWYKNYWLIDKGLKAGDRVIVDGIQRLRPDIPVDIESEQKGIGETKSAEK